MSITYDNTEVNLKTTDEFRASLGKSNFVQSLDSTSAFYFIDEITGKIPELFSVMYAKQRASLFVPIINHAAPTDQKVSYKMIDGVGVPEFISEDRSTEGPLVDVFGKTETYDLYKTRLGLDFTEHDIQMSRKTGRSLLDLKYSLVTESHARDINQKMIFGHKSPVLNGWVNNANITKIQVSSNAAGTSTSWDAKTPQEILDDISNAILKLSLDSKGNHIVDTIALPFTKWTKLNMTYRSTGTSETLMMALNSMYPNITIDWMFEIENKFPGDSQGFIAYVKDERYFGYELSQPLWSPIREVGDWSWKTNLYFKHGGILMIYPKSQIIYYGI